MKKQFAFAAIACSLLLTAPASRAQAPRGASGESPVFDVYEYVVEGNTVLPAEAIERAVQPFLGPGKQFSDIEAARAALEKLYQDAGYLTVLVSLPNQQVDAGEVRMEVTEAPVDKLLVTGAQHNLPSRIREQVPSLAPGQIPYFPQVQQELASLQSADMQVTPLINASESGQGIEVDLKVEDKPALSGSVEVNNSQSHNTRRGRVVGNINYANLFQRGHSLGLSWQYAPYRPQDGNTLSAIYGLPLSGRDDLLLSFTQSRSDTPTNVGSGPTATLTRGEFFGLRWSRKLDAQNWPARHSFFASLDYKNNRDFNSYDSGLDVRKPALRYPLLAAGYNIAWNGADNALTTFSTSFAGSTSAMAGRKVDCNGERLDQFDCKRSGSGPDFLAWQLAIGHGETVFGNWRLNLSADVQLASAPLPSGEQYSLGGRNTVRGYFDYEQTGDQGWSQRIELISPPWLQWGGVQFSSLVFADRGFVQLFDPQTTQVARTHLGSQGLGLRVSDGQGLDVKLDVARVAFDTLRATDNGQRAYASGPKAHRRYRVDLSVKQAF